MKSVLRFVLKLYIFSIPGLLLLVPAVVAAQSPITYSNYQDIIYRPLPERDGYTQAYSVNFRGNGFRIYTVFLISNIGPKSLNNGVAVLIYHKGESRVFTSEQDYRRFQAVSGGLEYGSGPHRLRLVGKGARALGAGGKLKLLVEGPQFRLELDLSKLQRGVSLSGGPLRISEDPEDFVRADVPIAFARARGRMSFAGRDYELNGVGGMEYLYTNLSPHHYAKSFALSRTYEADKGVFIGVIRGTDDFPDGYHARFAITRAGRLEHTGNITRMEVLRRQTDELSGYSLPAESMYYVEGPDGVDCRIHETVQEPAGGYSVLGHISSLLRWVLRVFFARPFILHYETDVVFACRADADAPYVDRLRFESVQNSHYLIND